MSQDRVQTIFGAWKRIHEHPRARLDVKRRRRIQDRLDEGYEPEELVQALEGARFSAHHMGQNDRHTVYDSIACLLRDADQVDKFCAQANGQRPKMVKTVVQPEYTPEPDLSEEEQTKARAARTRHRQPWMNKGTG